MKKKNILKYRSLGFPTRSGKIEEKKNSIDNNNQMFDAILVLKTARGKIKNKKIGN